MSEKYSRLSQEQYGLKKELEAVQKATVPAQEHVTAAGADEGGWPVSWMVKYLYFGYCMGAP